MAAVAVQTPSKIAAHALSTMDLNIKPEVSLLAKLKAVETPKITVVVEQESVEEYRKRFVGDLDCEEKDEPLLQETSSRFVLFPIKYREVSPCFPSTLV